jgi:hypothetical protein
MYPWRRCRPNSRSRTINQPHESATGEADALEKSAATGQQEPATGKKPRSEKQQAALAAGRAKRIAEQKAAAARKKGVNTSKGAGPDTSDLRPGAPKVVTTPWEPLEQSLEQKKRKADGKPEPDTSKIEPPAAPETMPDPAPAKRTPYSGLLGAIAEGLGL